MADFETLEPRLHLSVVPAPTITSPNHAVFSVGKAQTFAITASGSPTVTVDGTLPTGITLQQIGPKFELAGKPTDTAGVYTVTLDASNATGDKTQSFTLSLDQTPSFASGNVATFTTTQVGTFNVATTGFPTASLTATGLPAGLTLHDSHDGDAVISGTPLLNADRAYHVTLTARNSAGAVTQALTINLDQNTQITTLNHATASAGAAMDFRFTTTGFPFPTITETGALPPFGVALIDNGNGTGQIAGQIGAQAGGTYPLTLTADNGNTTVSQNFLLTVTQKPAFTSAPAATGEAGQPLTISLTTTGFPTAALAATGLPSGFNLIDNHDGTGEIVGTPAANAGKLYHLALTAKDSAGVATQQFTLTIDQPPAFTSANHLTVKASAAYTMKFTTTGFPAATVALGSELSPPGLFKFTSSAGTAILSGTAPEGSEATYTLSIVAFNSSSMVIQTFTLVVD